MSGGSSTSASIKN